MYRTSRYASPMDNAFITENCNCRTPLRYGLAELVMTKAQENFGVEPVAATIQDIVNNILDWSTLGRLIGDAIENELYPEDNRAPHTDLPPYHTHTFDTPTGYVVADGQAYAMNGLMVPNLNEVNLGGVVINTERIRYYGEA